MAEIAYINTETYHALVAKAEGLGGGAKPGACEVGHVRLLRVPYTNHRVRDGQIVQESAEAVICAECDRADELPKFR